MSLRTHKRLIIPVLAAFVLGLATLGQAQATATPSAARAPDNAINDVVSCDGGRQEAAKVAMDNQPTTIGENAGFVLLPDAEVSFNVPGGDIDQAIVTFSAEATLDGQTTPLTVPTDAMQLRILLDGVPMSPLNDLNFTTDAGHANAIEACRRVGAGNHAVTVEWFLFDQGAASVLFGTLDDWSLHVEIND
jgi:hypothetical protein